MATATASASRVSRTTRATRRRRRPAPRARPPVLFISFEFAPDQIPHLSKESVGLKGPAHLRWFALAQVPTHSSREAHTAGAFAGVLSPRDFSGSTFRTPCSSGPKPFGEMGGRFDVFAIVCASTPRDGLHLGGVIGSMTVARTTARSARRRLVHLLLRTCQPRPSLSLTRKFSFKELS